MNKKINHKIYFENMDNNNYIEMNKEECDNEKKFATIIIIESDNSVDENLVRDYL